MLTVGDIVSLDSKAQFRNDVQLDAYESAAKNTALLHSYLFSTATPNRDQSALRSISSLGLLDEVTNAFLNERLENRLVVVANFGHGKSHLALALANYFGKAANSEEVRILLDKISHTLRDEAKASRYEQFKQSRGEFLVVRLRGDVPQSLSTQFLLGLEKALEEHEATKDERLPFWFAPAERILSGLNDTQRAEADQFLEKHQKDVALLLSQIRDRQDVYDDVVGAIQAALGIKPDLREVSLSQTVEWATQKFTGPGKPLGGLLVLFDEFSLYISRYARRHAAADLQDLLNGVEKSQGKAVLLAFAQFDPLTTAENVSLSANERDDLKKALTRLPKKYALYSLMESVIDAYLKQSPTAWEKFTQPPNVKGPLHMATQITWDRFRKRYDAELRWDFEKFRETVTNGTYPLHPITTAMLCNVSLGAVPEGGVPRTVLGFVMEQLQLKQGEAALMDNRPNWVLPVNLVDYFEGRLDGELYTSYRNALRTAGADITSQQEIILKTLLLQELAGIRAREDEQFEFLWQSSGLTKKEAGEALLTLVENNSIRKDPTHKTYGLWPVTADPQKLEKTLREALEKLRFDAQALKELNALLCGKELKAIEFGAIPMAVDWGHQEDWAAVETVISANALTVGHVQALVQRTGFTSPGTIQEGDRGYVFWLLAGNEEELETIRNSAAQVLDQTLNGEAPHPVVMIMPSAPNPELIQLFQRWRALKSLNNTQRQDIGADMYLHELDRVEKELTREIAGLRGDPQHPFDLQRNASTYVVPKIYRAQINALGEANIRAVLKELYRMAYRWRPPEFTTIHKAVSGTKLRTATKTIAGSLLQNSPQVLRLTTQPDPIARDIRDKFLKQKWGLLAPDLRIQKPIASGVSHAWNLLDSTFAAGKTDIRLDSALMTLLNPPYGFDYNTAVLLFSAWFGYNALDLQVGASGRLITHDVFSQMIGKGAKDFVSQAQQQGVILSRRDRTTVEKRIREMIDRAQKPGYVFVQTEAEQDIAELMAFTEDERGAPDLRDTAKRCATDLAVALEAAQSYDRKAVEIEKELRKKSTLPDHLELYKQLNSLPRPGNVAITAPPIDELRSNMLIAIEAVVEMSIERHGQLASIDHYQLNRGLLQTDKKHLERASLGHLTGKIDQALRDLETRREELRRVSEEAPIRAEIEAMLTDARLVVLYDYQRRLKSLEDYSEETLAVRDRKLAKIENEIALLESRLRALQEQVAECVTVKTLRDLHANCMLIANRYKGSVYDTDVQALLDRIDVLGNFLATLDPIRHIQVKSPEAAEKALQELDDLESGGVTALSEQQQAMITQARTHVESQLAVRRAEATEWLARMETEANTGKDLPRLVIKLQAQPLFLPSGEQTRLQTLRAQVDEWMAQDRIMQIEKAFHELPNEAARQQCLERLQRIVSEDGHANEPVPGRV